LGYVKESCHQWLVWVFGMVSPGVGGGIRGGIFLSGKRGCARNSTLFWMPFVSTAGSKYKWVFKNYSVQGCYVKYGYNIIMSHFL